MPKKEVIKKSALAPTILIAGGAGFIGAHLAEKILQKEARVIALDNFSTGKKNHVEHLLSNSKFALFDTDINKGFPSEIQSVDYVVHLAGLEAYRQNKNNIDLDTLLTNSLGTKNLLDLAKKSSAKFLLVSSIDVYQGQLSSINLAKYFGKTVAEENKYELVEAKRFAEALVGEFYKRHSLNARIVRLPEIYGPQMDLDACSTLGLFIKELTQSKNYLTIPGDGTQKEYYLYIDDAVTGISKALFDKNTEGNIYTLTQNPQSILETAFLMRSVANKQIHIKYTTETNELLRESRIPSDTNLDTLKWAPKIHFKEGLIKTLESFDYNTNTNSFKPGKLIEEKDKEEKKIEQQQPQTETITSLQNIKTVPPKGKPVFSKNDQKKPIKSILAAIGLAVAVATTITIAIPTIQTYTNTHRGVAKLKQVPTQLKQLQTSNAKVNARKAHQNFTNAQSSLGKLKWLSKVLGKRDEFGAADRMLTSANYFSEAVVNITNAAEPFESIWEIIKPNSNRTFSQTQFDKAKSELAEATIALQLAQAEFKYVERSKLPAKFEPQLKIYEDNMIQATHVLNAMNTVVDDIPNLVGMDKPQKYLILFQNSNEIRPTGGFIGSYAILDISKGKIANLIIDDVYNPDGQIDIRNIAIKAPTPITQFLQEENLHIRNANWNPDFTKSAKLIENLFFKIDGTQFDGIFAIDLHVAKRLLDITGPIYLTAYNEEITAENLYERAQYHSEFNYQGGAGQKRTFLTILGSKLLEKTLALPQDKTPKLLTEIQKLLEEKHILLYLSGNPIGGVLHQNNWDGSLVGTSTDYLYVVNANLGGTKANYFIENTMNYKVSSDTRDGLLRATLTLNYTHTGQDTAWPGGPYTNYVRILTQEGTKLTGATINTGTAPTKNIFDEIVGTKENSYNAYGTAFTIQPQETATLIINYDLPQNIALTKDNTEYTLYWQKQPGTQNDKNLLEFKAPFGTTIKATTPQMTADGVNTLWEGLLNKDRKFHIELE